ncbi:MAG TPA: DUF885 domain-containing protein [Steroidobacteraceae bacterium]|nr:DUF885 domain-containing protein [Steroidobacteraceae bacterium]
MLRFLQAALLALAVSTLPGCGGSPAPPSAPPAARAASPDERLARLVEQYWDESSRLKPRPLTEGAAIRYEPAAGFDISAQSLADSLALERRYLDALLAVPRAGLDAESQLTYDIFKRERELAIESFTYPFELMPVNPFRSLPLEFARMGAGSGPYAVLSAQDYDAWRARAHAYARWTAQAIDNMREGLRRGYSVPRALVAEMLPILTALGADRPQSVFYQPLRSLPATLPPGERERLAAGITAQVKEEILPAYRTLATFLRDEYLPRARQSLGLSALPLGPRWYAFLIRRETASRLAPADIHALGIAEVERLHARLQALLSEAGFSGNAQAFFEAAQRAPQVAFNTPQELLDFYAQLKLSAAAALAALFAPGPQADFGIRPLDPSAAAGTPALSYQRATGRYPAVLHVDTALQPLLPDTALFLREALPGHHLQIATQQERSGLPRFRRFGGDPGFVEGWGLYAESLGEELGLYRDTESKFESLSDQLACAAALVVDTGLHALGWTREQAVDYWRAQVPVDEAAANRAVDRELALPAEGLACGLGMHVLSGLRAHAEQVLGARFDIRDFHSELIDDGAMPLDILESAANLWLSRAH